MNTTNILPDNKGQALFLAAILVLSMVAFAAVFAGSAAASQHDVDVSFSNESADIGEQVNVSFDINPATNQNAEVGSYDVEINYDNDTLTLVDMQGEDLPEPTFSEPSNGTITANAAQSTGEPVPLTAATLVFEVDSSAQDGDVASISLNDANSEFNDPVNPVTFESGPGSVEVVTSQADYQLSNLVPADATVTQGDDPIDVSVDVTNQGDDPGDQDITLTVTNETGDVVYSDTVAGVMLNPGESQTVTFQDVPAGDLAIGNYTHTAASNDDSTSGSLTVQEQPDVAPLEGLDIATTDGLTIGDDYPLNQRDIFSAPNSIYGLSGISLPPGAGEADERFTPIADGQHVGLTGLPVQDDVYQWVDDNNLLSFQDDAPTQTVAVSFEADNLDSGTGYLDYSEAAAHGLQLADVTDIRYDNIDPENVSVGLPANNQVPIDFQVDSTTDSPTIEFDLVWTAADPVEGLSVDRPNAIDYETDHRVIGPDSEQERSNFVVFEVGATGISHVDTNNANSGFIGEAADAVDLESNIEASGAADGTANDGSFLVWQNQRVTFETAQLGNTVDIYETAVDSDGNYTLGSKIPDDVVGFDDTAPGQVANLNTSNLTAGQQYFVTFGGNNDEAVVLDVRPLNLNAESDDIAYADRTDPHSINVESDDTTGGDVEAWVVKDELGTGIGDVIHVERDELTGAGDREMEIQPTVDFGLSGEDLIGDYTVFVLHTESGVTTTTDFTIQEPSQPDLVPAEDVNIVSPSLLDPEEPGLFDRGDIIPIELELIDGNVATLTFGDQADQNVELHATVADPSYVPEEEDDTTVTVYLNTYQIGHGMVENDTGHIVPNRPSWIAPSDWEDRQHGFFANPDDDAAILDVYASSGMDIYGGSQGGAVVSPGDIEDGPAGEYPGLRYDLHAIGGFTPHTETSEDRDDVNALDIEQRSTDDFTFWTAPGEGENALSIGSETKVDDIEALADQGILTQLDVEEETYMDEDGEEQTRLVFNDAVAEGDYLIVEAESTGIEGVLHEAVVRNSGLSVDRFLDRSMNHSVTDEFVAAMTEQVPRVADDEPNSQMLDYWFQLNENETSYQQRIGAADPNQELTIPNRVHYAPGLEGIDHVLAGLNEDGNMAEFYIPYKLEESTGEGDATAPNTLPALDDLDTADSLTFDSTVWLEPRGGDQENSADVGTSIDPNVPRSVNPLLSTNSLGVHSTDELDYIKPAVSIDDVHMSGGTLEVPGEANYTLTGTSTMAPGTTLDIEMLSLTGEGTPFFQEFLSVETTAQSGAAPATWEITADFNQTRNDVEIQPGTDFTTDITRAGGSTPLGGSNIPGVVLDDPAVQTFTFDNQRSDGDVVTVQAYQANRISQIHVQNADGEVLGSSGVLDRSLHEQFNIVLDSTVTENQELTAVAEIVQPEEGETLDERTAFINVEDESEAFFDVSGLDPQTATVEEGAEVEISATVENIGDQNGTQDVTLEVDGTTDSQELTLAGGASETVTFTVDAPSAGSYTHTVSTDDDEVAGALTVEEPPAPAEFQIVSISPQETTVDQGDTVTVSATVENVGDQEGTQDVTLDIDGISQSQSLTLAGGETGSVSFDVDTSDVDPGDYTHTVATEDAEASGSLTVEEVDDGNDTDGNETDDGDADDDGAGFGVAIAALALLGAALLAMRRQVE